MLVRFTSTTRGISLMTHHVLSRLQHGRQWHRVWVMPISRYLAIRHAQCAYTSAGWVRIHD